MLDIRKEKKEKNKMLRYKESGKKIFKNFLEYIPPKYKTLSGGLQKADD